ncbi:Nif3-like dinuclear metal center hexameric protein [Selenihalanaerobacter shriftii]|uniref:GTP cyclohydrolase 1 type 2 homolog n=1 Tax=Selenihalanaerobacter shriftii TaxID=142842 RepID=A0A1T4MXJ1_9FIRM|nr:Nif3-like dinuclear metal center hexameric protein [Selenihalanaerobacter shriftii]SJZ71800.1 dinuclear metal center protein, YbgI/SA1388 family [Selenihalanaerobacter shriftii]
MSLSAQQVIQLIEELAPKKLAADWDNVGLQVGAYDQRVSKVLVTLDVNRAVMDEAIAKEVDLIISHHPVIFKSLSEVRFDTEIGRIIRSAIKNEINIYVAHTNYDIAKGGLNDLLADKLDLLDVQILQPTFEDEVKKLVTFVPEESIDEVREAITSAGAGWIGNYSDCTFQMKGVGAFKPLADSTPYLGEEGQLESVKEVRLETIVPASKLKRVINKLNKVHPYEEVAYDIYPVEINGESFGLGRIGKLKASLSFVELIAQVKKQLGVADLRVVEPKVDTIKKIALCSGSGADLIKKAAFKGADLLLTGDLKYHDAELAVELGLGIIDAGHYGTEIIMQKGIVEYLKTKIQERGLEEIEVSSAKSNKGFIQIV